MVDLKREVNDMKNFKNLLEFLQNLENKGIYFKLNHIRNSILVEIVIPGERWEVEFMINGDVEIEKFVSNGEIHDESLLNELFEKFSD